MLPSWSSERSTLFLKLKLRYRCCILPNNSGVGDRASSRFLVSLVRLRFHLLADWSGNFRKLGPSHRLAAH